MHISEAVFYLLYGIAGLLFLLAASATTKLPGLLEQLIKEQKLTNDLLTRGRTAAAPAPSQPRAPLDTD